MTPWQRWTIRAFILMFFLTFQPTYRLYAEDKDTATEALKSINGILTSGGQAIGAIGASQQQMQAMMNQFAMMQSKNLNLGAQQGAIQQVQQQLGDTLGRAQLCMQNAVKDVKKYKKNKFAPSQLEPFTNITCENYGNLIDSVRANLDKIDEVNTRLQCMKTLQNEVNQIASASQGLFQKLTQTANEVWNVRDQMINSHKEIADQIEAEVDGENGYRAKLNSLKKLSLELQQVVYGRTEYKAESGLPGGYAQKLANLKSGRQKIAKQWYQSISNKTQACFTGNPFMECSVGQPMAPIECIMNHINNSSGKNVGGEKRSKANKEAMIKSLTLARGKIFEQGNQLTNLDINNPNAFLEATDKGFEAMLNDTMSAISRQQFMGAKINKDEIINFARSKYRECYQLARKEFQADLSSTGEYKDMYDSVKANEAQLTSELKNWVDIVSNQMSEFKQSFSKVYNNDLEKFSAQCTAGDSPYQAYDCLATLRANLKSGIEGTTQFYKTIDGTQHTADVGNTTLNVSTVTVDQTTGKPTVSQSQIQCRGFNECISFLDKSKAHHRTEEKNQTKARQEFVEQHNKTFQGALSAIGAQFGAISQMFVASAGELTQQFNLFGVQEAIKTKEVEGEALVANEKTGLYDMPKSMKAAFAGTGSYSELDAPETIASTIAERRNTLNKKLVDAAKKKIQCDVKRSDYDEVAKRLGSCNADLICKGETLSGSIRTLEQLMRKSQKNPDESESVNRLYDEHDRCIQRAREKNGALTQADATILQGSTIEEKRAARAEAKEAARAEQAEEIKNCSKNALESIDALAGNSRDSLKSNNVDITNALRTMAGSCPDNPDAAEEACNKAKKAAEKAVLPDNEGETPIKGYENDSKDDNKKNPLSSRDAQ